LDFATNLSYSDRRTKAEYVWLKYEPILRGAKILDVGADECYLKHHLDDGASYWGIGLGGNPDQHVDLETEEVPFPDEYYDCVLCLDVLEHLENIHEIFNEVCRVTKRYVILSMPNPWSDFYNVLRFTDYRPNQPTKFYGLPLERPADRHKWFFSSDEAEKFVTYRAGKNSMRVVQIDYHGMNNEGHGWRRFVREFARSILFRRDLNLKALYAGTLWAVLEK